jgi:hypothetical protein
MILNDIKKIVYLMKLHGFLIFLEKKYLSFRFKPYS